LGMLVLCCLVAVVGDFGKAWHDDDDLPMDSVDWRMCSR